MSKVSALAHELLQAKKTYENFVSRTITDASGILFKDNPNLKTICWYTYVPLFNDGEPCEYILRGAYFTTLSVDEIEEDGRLVNEDFNGFTIKATEDTCAFAEILVNNLDILEGAYGSYSKIFIPRDGQLIRMEYEYDGD